MSQSKVIAELCELMQESPELYLDEVGLNLHNSAPSMGRRPQDLNHLVRKMNFQGFWSLVFCPKLMQCDLQGLSQGFS
ncbi:hypothetical protein BDZ97DRAFT_1789811 [Flammula alnicola]|nr:hypothetical protein BDZ97DRAFT_1789811 [Flammula alnicola]